MRLLGSLLALAGTLPGQVFVVDAANGPGAHFTSIAAAVAAVPDGAVLAVRAGVYSGFQVAGKGLAILGEPGVLISDPAVPTITVDAIASSQTLVLRGLAVAHPVGPAQIACGNSAGAIVIDRCRADHTTTPQGGRLVAQACDQLHVRETSLLSGVLGQSALTINGGATTIVGCSLGGLPSPIRCANGELDLVASTVTGVGFAPAIQLTGAELRVRGRTSIAGSIAPGFFALAVNGTGRMYLDPNTTLRNVPTPPFGAGLTVQTIAMPWLEATPGTAGGSTALALTGSTSGAGALVVGFPDRPYAIAGLADPVWLRPGAVVVHAVGGATLTAAHAVPNAPWVLGVTLAWQGLTFAPGPGPQVSNPATYAH